MALNEFDNILGGGKPAQGNEYDALLGETQDRAQIVLRQSMTQAAQTTPDQSAKVIELSRKSNLPVEIVHRNYDTLAKKYAVEGNDYDAMMRQTPKLAAWLAEGENAAVASDDLARMGSLEWMVTAPSRAWKRGTAQVEFGNLSAASMFRDLSAPEHARMKLLRDQMGEGGDLGAQTWFGKALVGGAQQLPMLFGGLVAGAEKGAPMALTFGAAATIAGQVGPQVALPEEVVTVPAAAAIGYYIGSSTGSSEFSFKQEAGHAYEEFSKFKDELGKPLDPNVARAAAIAAGGINAGLEVFQLNTLMRSVPGADKLFGAATRTAIQEALRRPTVRSALQEMMLGYGRTLTTETITEVAQRAVTILSGELGKVASGQDIAKRTTQDIIPDLANEAIEAAQAFTYLAAPGHMMRAGQEATKIREAKKQEAFFLALGEGVTESKTFQRMPDKVQEFIADATKDGPIETVYIPVESWIQYFQEKGLDPKQVASEVLGSTESYDSAVSTGTDLPVKLAAYATRLAPTEHNAFFAQELRLAPDQMNAREAVEFETQLAAEQKAANDAQQQQQQVDQTEQAAQQVTADVTAKLVASGVEQATAGAYAATYGAAFRSIAQRAGVDPKQLYERFGLKIEREGITQPGATELNQAKRVADDVTPLERGPLAGVTREQFLGNPKITNNANAADLKPKELSSLNDAQREPFLGGEYEAKFNSDGAVVYDGDKVVASYNFGDTLVVDKPYRRLGIGEELVYQWRTRNPNAKPADNRTKSSQALQEKVWERIKSETRQIDPLTGDVTELGQPVYHGSPHDFDAFDITKIGTGEGAAAYGWGLYLAENPSVAAGYYRQLADNPAIAEMKVGTKRISQRTGFNYSPRDDTLVENVLSTLVEDLLINENALHAAGPAGFAEYVLKELDDKIANYWDPAVDPKMIEAAKTLRKMLARPGALSIKFDKSTGGVYQANIDDHVIARMLLWDKPISEQPGVVQQAISKLGLDKRTKLTPETFPAEMHAAGGGKVVKIDDPDFGPKFRLQFDDGSGYSLTWKDVMRMIGDDDGSAIYNALVEKFSGDQKAASLALLAAGVPGIKYKDAGSRGITVNLSTSKGPYNRVTLDTMDQARRYADEKRAEGFIVEIDESGTHNIVAFDDKIITVTHKDGSPLTPQEKKELEQRQDGTKLAGRISFGNDRQFKIDLLKDADLSTFLHESGHFWLEVLGDVVDDISRANPTTLSEQQIKMASDYQTLLNWLGAKDRTGIKVDQHEQFARGIESYVMEGKAPSAELRSVFAKFRAWMLSIYRSLRSLNVTLTPEVRDVMDRMFATDSEIEAAQNEALIAPLFTDAKSAGMTDIEFGAYKGRLETASTRARDELQAKLLRTLTREREQWWKSEREKERKEVETAVHARPEYIALSVLQSDKMPNGDPLPYDLQRVKLDRKALAEQYGEDFWKSLPRGTTAATGIHPNTAAELVGYGSGEELVKALGSVKPMRQAIEQETDARMRAKHGDVLVDGTMIEAARAAVQNDDRVKVIEAELRALNKLRRESARAVDAERQAQAGAQAEGIRTVSGSVPPLSAVRQMAAGRVAASRVRDLTPGVYLTAARKNGAAAIKAAAVADYSTAMALKQRELMNVELFRYATRAIDEVEKSVDYLQSFGEAGKRGRIGKAGQDYLDQIDGFLERYDFARVPLKTLERRKALVAWIAEKERQGETVDLPPEVVVEKRMNWKDMTVEELEGVRDSVKHIEHLSRLKNRLLTAKRNKDLAEVVTEIEESIRANAGGTAKRTKETRLPGDAAMRFVDGWFGSHRKIASIARELDGLKDAGPMWEYVIRPLNEAGDREATMNADATAALGKLFDVYKGAEMRALYVKTRVDAIGESLTKMARLVVALNWGNADNRQKIMDGYTWNEAQVQAILDTLDERDWKFVQGVWDFIDGYWPQIEAKEKRVKGVAPEKVQRSTVMTKFGEFAGGYYPLKYDDRQSPKAQKDLVKETAEMMMRAGYGTTSTKRGHTKERVEGVREPIRLDLGVVFEHTTQVIHDLTHHEALIDVNRIMNAKAITGAVVEHYGNATLDQFTDAITDIAAGDVGAQKTVERAVNWVRQGVSIAAMGWNLMTSLLQPLGLSQSIVRIGPKWVGRGMSRWLRDASGMENSAKWVNEKSEFMRNRARTQMREMNEIRNQVGVNTGKFSGWIDQAMSTVTLDKVNKQAVVDSYFWLIHKAQQIADLPTWMGAYEKALDSKADEATAIALADQAVLDSQGGGQMKDLAGIQRGGPMLKLWTNFYSYFNVTYNLTAEGIARTKWKSPASIGRLAVDFLMLYTLPASLGFMMRNALTGKDDEDPDTWRKKLIAENLSYLFGSMVLLRELGGAIQGYAGYKGPAGAGFFAAVGNAVKQVGQGEADAAFWRSLNETAGILFHYPAGQVKRSTEGFVAMQEGRTRNPMALIVGAPKE